MSDLTDAIELCVLLRQENAELKDKITSLEKIIDAARKDIYKLSLNVHKRTEIQMTTALNGICNSLAELNNPIGD